jgi:hypothetical protein
MILKQLATNCFKVVSGKKTYYFSYETCVAYEDEFNAVRLDKKISVTTSRHRVKMGVNSFTPLPEDYFLTFIS